MKRVWGVYMFTMSVVCIGFVLGETSNAVKLAK